MKAWHSAAYPIAKARGLRGEFSVKRHRQLDIPTHMEDPVGLEPTTLRLTVVCSKTN